LIEHGKLLPMDDADNSTAPVELPAYTSVPASSAGTSAWSPPRAAPELSAAASRAGYLSDLPFQAPAGWEERTAAAASFAIVLTGVLPWRDAPGLSYFTLWGLATPANWVVLLLALAVGLVAITPSRLPDEVRWGFGPVLVGAFALGAGWMWQGLYAAAPGLWLFLLASAVTLGAGVLRLWEATRRI
jgi:hypothetical protein